MEFPTVSLLVVFLTRDSEKNALKLGWISAKQGQLTTEIFSRRDLCEIFCCEIIFLETCDKRLFQQLSTVLQELYHTVKTRSVVRPEKNEIEIIMDVEKIVCLWFYGPVNTTDVILSRSVKLLALFLGRLKCSG